MKKIVAIAALLAMALALAACAAGSLNIDNGSDGVHVVAKNGANGTVSGDITIPEKSGMCINHIIEKGSFHIKATNSAGTVVFDDDITDNIANLVSAQGKLEVQIDAKNATGTVDIIPYDVEAQAQADASLDEALAQAGTSREAVGLSGESAR